MPTYGAYKSVNTLPHYADLIKEHGPFDPKVKVNVRLSKDGRYTLEGVDAFGEDGKVLYKLDLRKFINNAINGVYYYNDGQIRIDGGGDRWFVFTNEANPGYYLPYSINAMYKGLDGMFYVTNMALPSDHPFLQAFQPV